MFTVVIWVVVESSIEVVWGAAIVGEESKFPGFFIDDNARNKRLMQT